YVLAAPYAAGSRRAPRTPALRLMDGAVTLLVVSTLGVLLLMADGLGGTSTPRSVSANAEFFLTLFADGWFGLGLLGALAATRCRGAAPRGFGAATWALAAGLCVRSGGRPVAGAGGARDDRERSGEGLAAARGPEGAGRGRARRAGRGGVRGARGAARAVPARLPAGGRDARPGLVRPRLARPRRLARP